MWADEISPTTPWLGPWRFLITCPRCRGLRDPAKDCPVCGAAPASMGVYQGAILWSDYVLLEMMKRDWVNKATAEAADVRPALRNVPQHATIVILFWTLFESQMDRLLREAAHSIPDRVAQDLLKRYGSIGARLERLFPLLTGHSFREALADCGFPDLHEHLRHVQEARNAFVHGNPESIDEQLVLATVERLPEFQSACIELWNDMARESHAT